MKRITKLRGLRPVEALVIVGGAVWLHLSSSLSFAGGSWNDATLAGEGAGSCALCSAYVCPEAWVLVDACNYVCEDNYTYQIDCQEVPQVCPPDWNLGICGQ